MVSSPIPTVGSPLTFTPAPAGEWVVTFTDADETWTVQVIGWSVVVTHCMHDRDAHESGDYETRVMPMLLDEESSYPLPLREYLDDLAGPVNWSLRRVVQ